jgi:hypothetical protein
MKHRRSNDIGYISLQRTGDLTDASFIQWGGASQITK